MTTDNKQVPMKQIAYWPDAYFLDQDDAAEMAEIYDEFKIYGEEPHTLLDVPASARFIQIKALIYMDLGQGVPRYGQ